MAVSTETSEIITGIMEIVAERAGDITPRVFERYFELSTPAKSLMDHMDEHMLGRMMDQVLLLLMETDDEELAGYLNFETHTHISYGVDSDMYHYLMAAVRDVIEHSLGDDFTADMADAFATRTEFLLQAIDDATAQESQTHATLN